jgi:hypothetical protein
MFIIEWIKKYAGKLHQKIVCLGRLMFLDNKVKTEVGVGLQT